MPAYILTITCPDGPGIIHAVSGALLDVGANVLEQEQYSDLGTGLFFARTKFESPIDDVDHVRSGLAERTAPFSTEVGLRLESQHRRALILVSQYDHCLLDLLYRRDAGELPLDVVGIVSNHETCRPIAERYGIAFNLLPVTPETKAEQEQRMLAIVDEQRVDLVVLARYMQILSDDACRRLHGRVINIHHSFLPGFKGARPYHQAHARGVKLIGATAHFVTSDLDEGPIIEQEVERVNHTLTADALAEIGRDVERLALSRAVKLFAQDRVFLNRDRTVVFGA
ncbi:MAG TPA: formyltetrahydrofolate deformylase [Actinobacteria bacterium]|nr:formyltetrahydrofolate deformylase [Actinomycetota bacterium]